jgi:tRNA(Arg) A34 adenosine deaminase TadA
MIEPKEKYMRVAIDEALKSKRTGNYAIGAVIVQNDRIIGRQFNITRSSNDPTRHAEIEVIRKVLKTSRGRFLEDCTLYTTHEPCPMCATAAVWVKLKGVVFGAKLDDMTNYSNTYRNEKWAWRTVPITARDIFAKGEPKVELVEEFLRDECKKLFHH